MGDPETHFGECNVACGTGTRHKIVHDFSTGVTSITEEACDMPACTAEINVCPEIEGVATTTTAAPVVVDEAEVPVVTEEAAVNNVVITVGATVGTNVNVEDIDVVTVVAGVDAVNGAVSVSAVG